MADSLAKKLHECHLPDWVLKNKNLFCENRAKTLMLSTFGLWPWRILLIFAFSLKTVLCVGSNYFWRLVTWMKIYASSNYCKKIVAEASRLIPQKLTAKPKPADIFGWVKMIVTSCCIIFGGQNDCKLLLYQTIKRAFENSFGGNFPVAHPLVAGLAYSILTVELSMEHFCDDILMQALSSRDRSFHQVNRSAVV